MSQTILAGFRTIQQLMNTVDKQQLEIQAQCKEIDKLTRVIEDLNQKLEGLKSNAS